MRLASSASIYERVCMRLDVAKKSSKMSLLAVGRVEALADMKKFIEEQGEKEYQELKAICETIKD